MKNIWFNRLALTEPHSEKREKGKLPYDNYGKIHAVDWKEQF